MTDSKDVFLKIKKIKILLFLLQVMEGIEEEIDLKISLVKDSEKAHYKAKN